MTKRETFTRFTNAPLNWKLETDPVTDRLRLMLASHAQHVSPINCWNHIHHSHTRRFFRTRPTILFTSDRLRKQSLKQDVNWRGRFGGMIVGQQEKKTTKQLKAATQSYLGVVFVE